MEHSVIELHESPPSPPPKSPTKSTTTHSPPQPSSSSTSSPAVIDKTLSSAANLTKLLPSGTVFIFQALSPSFTNKGQCYPSNKYLTYSLLLICSLSCIFFSFTDTLKSPNSHLYYGIATFKGFYIFNYDDDQETKNTRVKKDLNLKRFRLRVLDYVHAVFTVVVFLALTFGDANVQRCLFPGVGSDGKELLVNMPMGAAVVAGLVFMVFPTKRKGIGYSDATPHQQL